MSPKSSVRCWLAAQLVALIRESASSKLETKDVEECMGTLSVGLKADAGHWGCDDRKESVCNETYTTTPLQGVYIQCGQSSNNCLATGPFCKPAPCGFGQVRPGTPLDYQASSASADFDGAQEVGIRGNEAMCGDGDDNVHIFYVHVKAGSSDSSYRVGMAKENCCSLESSTSAAASFDSSNCNAENERGAQSGRASTENWWREEWFGTENVDKVLMATVKCWQSATIRPSILLSQPDADDYLGEVSWPSRAEDATWLKVFPYAQFKESNQVLFSKQKTIATPQISDMHLAFFLNPTDSTHRYRKDSFWTDCKVALASNPSTASWSADLKTDAFCSPMGKWVKIVAMNLKDNAELASAVYPVLQYMETFSFKDLFDSDKKDRVFTKEKNNLLSRGSMNSPLVEKILGGDSRKDVFMDESYALVANHDTRRLGNSKQGQNQIAGMGIEYPVRITAHSYYRGKSEMSPQVGRNDRGGYGSSTWTWSNDHGGRTESPSNNYDVGYAVYVGGTLQGDANP